MGEIRWKKEKAPILGEDRGHGCVPLVFDYARVRRRPSISRSVRVVIDMHIEMSDKTVIVQSRE